ncbi:bifunctional adenosylcobinamide kinase/adenosylcobinamide-phosphate guanylyltransferase [Mitsuokella sp.]|uniref:bifunctional adenosylcobinamide kinase/adenosylcobinamide-phosphate guanylyltransferase n=1 Tax=Mitsuokella sp. TaxID=2049034 RepID=UPI003D7D4C90
MGKMILVTGGARSGKSAFAEKITLQAGMHPAYIATAEIWDEEMNHRVALHQKRRSAVWQTYEAPQNAKLAIAEAGKAHDVILFDCVTMYLSNLLCRQQEPLVEAELENMTRAEMTRLLQAVKMLPEQVTVVFVTNEVGAGIVPENKLARFYRDLAGLANQQLAAAADAVYAVLCGIPLRIK